MADIKTYTTVSASLVALIAFGFLAVPDPNYSCDSKRQVAYCFNLSSTKVTCYTLPAKKGGKTCSEGWKQIFEKRTGGRQEICDPCNENDRKKCPPCRELK